MSKSSANRTGHTVRGGHMAGPPSVIKDKSSRLPPKLPPIQLITHKSSFADLFRATNGAGVMMDEPLPSPLRPLLDLNLPTTKLPETAVSYLSSLSLPESRQSTYLPMEPPTKKVDSYHTSPIAQRSTSSGSSTLRSLHSGGTPPPSRPSSRSSVDEAPSTSHVYTKQSHIELKGRPQSQPLLSPPIREELGLRKSPTAESNVRAQPKPHKVSGSNKPLPPAPRNTFAVPDPLQIHKSAFGSVRIAIPEPPISKRGERLGQQMVGKTTVRPKIQTSRLSIARQMRSRVNNNSDSESDEAPLQQTPTSLVVRSKYSSHGGLHSSTPERVLLKILSQLETLDDLQNVSMVNRGFQRAFKRYESDLVSRVLFRFSRPAWELRQIMKCNQQRNAFKLRSVQHDTATLHALQSFILMKCESICRQTTIDGLLCRNITRRQEIDDALWRIWIFCHLFGKSKGQEENAKSQLVWLNGGERKGKDDTSIALGVANGSGLSLYQLEDMSEMWSCLEALLTGFRNREPEARRAGIFDFCEIDQDTGLTEQALLNFWVDDILSLGPKAVLTLISCSFEQAKVLGITNWHPPESGKSRANFCKGAIEHVYRQRLVSDARSKALEFEKTMRSQHRPSSNQFLSPKAAEDRLRDSSPSGHERKPSLQIVTTKSTQVVKPSNTKAHHNQSVAPQLTPQLGTQPSSHSPGTPGFSSFAITHGASARLGATLFPMQYPGKQSRLSTVMERSHTSPTTLHMTNDSSRDNSARDNTVMVRDPTDLALLHLVRDRKFPEAQARQALARSDNGTGINLQRAIYYLTNQQSLPVSKSTNHMNVSELPSSTQVYTIRPDSEFRPQTHSDVQIEPRQTRKVLRRSTQSTTVTSNFDCQVDGYLHVPVPIAKQAPTESQAQNRTSLSQRLRVLQKSPNKHVISRDRAEIRSHLFSPASNENYRASTMSGIYTHSSADMHDEIEKRPRPSRLWSLRDFKKKDTGTGTGTPYIF